MSGFIIPHFLQGYHVGIGLDQTLGKRDTPRPRSIRERVDGVVGNQLGVTSTPTLTQRAVLEETESMFTGVHADLRRLLEEDLRELERLMEQAGAPWTPGRLPDWEPK